MRALVFTGPHRFEMREVDRPAITPDEVLIEVKAVGICGSDVHGMTGETGRRQPPVIMGHEAAGVIVEAGRNVEGYELGDPVTFDSTVYCNRCEYCVSGRPNLCSNRKVLGVSCDEYRLDGAMAEYVAVPWWVLSRVPEGMPFEKAAMVEPLSIGFHAVERAQIQIGDLVSVVGCGIIGLSVIQVAKLTGCRRIVAMDIDDRRLAKAAELGADLTVNPKKIAPSEVFARELGRSEVDVSFEAVGNSAAVGTALAAVRKGGKLVLIGNMDPEITVSMQSIVTREIDVLGSYAAVRAVDTCIGLIADGRVDVDSLISRVAPLEEGAKWFDTLLEAEEPLFKVILEP